MSNVVKAVFDRLEGNSDLLVIKDGAQVLSNVAMARTTMVPAAVREISPHPSRV